MSGAPPPIPPKPGAGASAAAVAATPASPVSGGGSGGSSGGAESAPTLELKGHDLMDEAEKLVKSWFNKKSQAITTFESAAGQFKKAGQYQLAATAYTRAGEVSELNKQSFEAANYYTHAAKMYRHTGDVKLALEQYELAVHIAISESRLGAAAHLYKGMAEIHESMKSWKSAIGMYEKAADCFQAQDTLSQANQSLVKAGSIAIDRHEWAKAQEMFERAARNVEPSKLVQVVIAEYLAKAALCVLVVATKQNNLSPARIALAKYATAATLFKHRPQYTLLVGVCVHACIERDRLFMYT